MTYFHPLYCNSVKTRLWKIFRSLVSKHFNKDHKFYKIFNKNSIKISNSCLSKVNSVINAHNRKVLDDDTQTKTDDDKTCNCRKKDDFPLERKCLTSNIIYSAEITSATSGSPKVYIGSTSNTFKQRFYGHKASFSNEKLKGSTQLVHLETETAK